MAAPFGLLTMLIGIAALQQLPDLANPEEAFARSMMSAMPVGLRALMMSAILAAVVTSGESSVNAATALFVNDVCKRLVPDRSDRFYLRLSQVSCAVLGLVALVLALNAPHIVEYIRLGLHDPHARGDHRADGPVLARRQRHGRGGRHHRRHARRPRAGRIFGDPRALDPFWIAAPVTFAGHCRRFAASAAPRLART